MTKEEKFHKAYKEGKLSYDQLRRRLKKLDIAYEEWYQDGNQVTDLETGEEL